MLPVHGSPGFLISKLRGFPLLAQLLNQLQCLLTQRSLALQPSLTNSGVILGLSKFGHVIYRLIRTTLFANYTQNPGSSLFLFLGHHPPVIQHYSLLSFSHSQPRTYSRQEIFQPPSVYRHQWCFKADVMSARKIHVNNKVAQGCAPRAPNYTLFFSFGKHNLLSAPTNEK